MNNIPDDIVWLLLSIGVLGTELEHLDSLLPMNNQVVIRATARQAKFHLFGANPILTRLPCTSRRGNLQPFYPIYDQYNPTDSWKPLRSLIECGKPIDLDRKPR